MTVHPRQWRRPKSLLKQRKMNWPRRRLNLMVKGTHPAQRVRKSRVQSAVWNAMRVSGNEGRVACQPCHEARVMLLVKKAWLIWKVSGARARLRGKWIEPWANQTIFLRVSKYFCF